jgi:hypothetical protein
MAQTIAHAQTMNAQDWRTEIKNNRVISFPDTVIPAQAGI